MIFKSLCSFIVLIIFSFSSLAEEIDYEHYGEQKLKDVESHYYKITQRYKKYLSNVPKNVRDEITKFRIEIAQLQSKKRDLYNRLSIQAQEYLANEQAFRQKLPIDNKGQIIIQDENTARTDQTNK